MTATIKDVARAAGVSVASVSRALNGHESVTDATRQRILAAAGQLRYVPHAAARSLITRRTDTIGALLPANPQDAWLVDTYSVNSTGIMGPGHGRLIDPATTLSFPPLGNLGTFTGMQVIANAATDVVTIVPEPATGILLLAGCVFLSASRRAS